MAFWLAGSQGVPEWAYPSTSRFLEIATATIRITKPPTANHQAYCFKPPCELACWSGEPSPPVCVKDGSGAPPRPPGCAAYGPGWPGLVGYAGWLAGAPPHAGFARAG